jgi:hypothetical protein
MGFLLMPLMILAFFGSVIAFQQTHVKDNVASAKVSQASTSAQSFLAYRAAVGIYLQNNPAFTGTVTSAMLSAQGVQFPAGFIASAGNAITATANNGRVITCFAALPTGAITVALTLSENDASLGIANGTNWSSSALNGALVPLATAVPNGNIVSVVQIGV